MAEKVTVRNAREIDALCATILAGWQCKSESRDGNTYHHRWYAPGQDFAAAETCVTTMNAQGQYVGNHIARVIPRFSSDMRDGYRIWEEAIRGAQEASAFIATFSLLPLTTAEKEAIQKAEEAEKAGKKKKTGKPVVVRQVVLTVTKLDEKGEIEWAITDKPAMTYCLASLRSKGLEVAFATATLPTAQERLSATRVG